MQQVRLETPIPYAPEAVWNWHTRPGAFERLSPPWRPVRVLQSGTGIRLDEGKTLALSSGLLPIRWQLRHVAVEPGHGFVDEQVDGPFSVWRHEHWFEPDGATGCRLVDSISYRLPAGRISDALAGTRVRDELERVLRFRHARLAHDLGRHADWSGQPLRIAISGASGHIGRQLTAFLTSGGHDVVRLVRGTAGITGAARWDPETGAIDAAALEGLDAVIHLAGENISSSRWTRTRRKAIRDSRVAGTQLLAQTLASLDRPPRVFISASAIGIYGDRGAEWLTEASTPGDDFLSQVCQAWETAAEPARCAGIRVVHPRLGVVISTSGGLLARSLPVFQLGLGGRLGSGRQWLSWISLDDLLALQLHVIADETLAGPVNAVSPQPVTNRELTAILGRALHRPTVLSVPAPALRLAFGQLADGLLLASQRALPAQLARTSFDFSFASIADAIHHELGRLPDRALQSREQARSTASDAEAVIPWP
jgi:uncharacterized protein (TIGR01777 family)